MNYNLINYNLINYNMNKLPLELNNKIYFMACGHQSLTLTLQHKKVQEHKAIHLEDLS